MPSVLPRGRSAAISGLRTLQGMELALAPATIEGQYDNYGVFPKAAVDVIPQVVTDPGQLSRKESTRCLGAATTGARQAPRDGVW